MKEVLVESAKAGAKQAAGALVRANTGSSVLGAMAGEFVAGALQRVVNSLSVEYASTVQEQLLENVRAARDFNIDDAMAASAIVEELLSKPESESSIRQGFWYQMQSLDRAVHPAIALLVSDYVGVGKEADAFFRQAGRLLASFRLLEFKAMRTISDEYLRRLPTGSEQGYLWLSPERRVAGAGLPDGESVILDSVDESIFIQVAHALKEARLGADGLSGAVGGSDPTEMVRFTRNHLESLGRLRRYLLVPPPQEFESEQG